MTSGTAVDVLVTLHGANEDYIRATAVLYASMRTHTRAHLRFTIIHDDTVPSAPLARLINFIGERDEARCVDVTACPAIAAICRECADARYSPAVLWRVFAADLVPDVDRVVMLDADLVFLCDVERLWRVELEGRALAAVLRGKPWLAEYHALIATPPERYFRIGMTVLNLGYLRADRRFLESREAFLRTTLPRANALVCLPEQSVFNHYFNEQVVPLATTLVPAGHFNPADVAAVQRWLGAMDVGTDVVLDLKGWQHRTPFDYFYWTYLLMTPWRDSAYAELARHQAAAAADDPPGR